MEEIFKLIIPLALLVIGIVTRPKKKEMQESPPGESEADSPQQESGPGSAGQETAVYNESTMPRQPASRRQSLEETLVSPEQFRQNASRSAGERAAADAPATTSWQQGQNADEEYAWEDMTGHQSPRQQQKPMQNNWESEWQDYGESWHEKASRSAQQRTSQDNTDEAAYESVYTSYPEYSEYSSYRKFPQANRSGSSSSLSDSSWHIANTRDLTRAIVWSEIVGTPVSLRTHPEPHRQW